MKVLQTVKVLPERSNSTAFDGVNKAGTSLLGQMAEESGSAHLPGADVASEAKPPRRFFILKPHRLGWPAVRASACRMSRPSAVPRLEPDRESEP